MVSILTKKVEKNKKKMVSGRVPLYVVDYAKKQGLSMTDLMMKGFDAFRATDREHAVKRLEYHKNCVLHWTGVVLQSEEECNTKVRICNTIKADFLENGRGNSDSKRQDLSWCKARAEKLVEEGIIITGEELYEYCTSGQ